MNETLEQIITRFLYHYCYKNTPEARDYLRNHPEELKDFYGDFILAGGRSTYHSPDEEREFKPRKESDE